MSEPRDEYASRLAERRGGAARLSARQARISNARLAVFALGAAGVLLIWGAHWLPPLALAPPALLFLALVVWHDRVIAAREQADRAVAFYERGLERLDGTWHGRGSSGEEFLDPHHPYAADLDIFGSGSMFELLCTARTASGEMHLAEWLSRPASPEEVRKRQAGVAELRPRLDLREELALLGEDLRLGIHPKQLAEWGAREPLHGAREWRMIVAGLGTFTLLALFAWLARYLGFASPGPYPFVIALFLGGLTALHLRGRVRGILASAEAPLRELALLARFLERLDQERFECERLATLRQALSSAGAPAWREVLRLERLLVWADARRNQLFAPFAAILLWGLQFSLAVEVWRQRCGLELPRWLAAVGEIEALVALASHAYENPEDPFPELVEAGPEFDGEGLGHPLLPTDRIVRNDVRLDAEHAVYVVSGSNMSGKSTWLRTVGANTVLALAGATVRARRLRVSTLALGASIRVHDSLQEGESRFYAEIKRLRQIVELAGDEIQLLFLLDEILHGTNSHDRRIGAAAVVRDLVRRGAVGLVTTHDLALARIADELAPRAANVHFEDHLEDGRIAFDYRLRAGVVEKSNALALMREVGLDV